MPNYNAVPDCASLHHGYGLRRDRSTTNSPAAGELAVRVLQREGAKLSGRIVAVGGGDQPLRREFLERKPLVHEEALDIEHAVDVDPAVRIARRPGIFVDHLAARLDAGADRDVD